MRYRGIDDAQEYSYVWFNDDGKSVAVLHCVLWLNALTHSTHPHMLSNFSRTMNPFCARQFIIFANNETDSSRLSQQLMFAAADSKAKTNGTFEFFITFIPHVYREVAALSHTVRRHPAGIFFFLLLSASRMIYDREPARAHVCAREQQQQQNSRREKWNEKKREKVTSSFLFFHCFYVFAAEIHGQFMHDMHMRFPRSMQECRFADNLCWAWSHSHDLFCFISICATAAASTRICNCNI